MKKRKLIKVRFRLTKIKKFRFCTFLCKQRQKFAVASMMSIMVIAQGVTQIHQIRATRTATRGQKIRKALAIAEMVIQVTRGVRNTFSRIYYNEGR